ncbi:MAG: PQQ-dependent sugar dehydrogenase [Aggregatilineales bacterium]
MKYKFKFKFITMIFIILLMATSVSAQDDGPPSSIGLEMIAEGLTTPLDLQQPNDDSGRLFIVDQIGVIHVITGEGELLETPLLDITDRLVGIAGRYDERGLLGMALHPDFANNGRLFVNYSAPLQDGAPEDWNHTTHISEFTVSADDSNQVNPGSERVLLRVNQPQSNHNGGDIEFGPDGYLYIPLGDGGNADDVGLGHNEDIGNAQDLSTMLGKILRIDVDNGDPYAIPEDNPFMNNEEALDEIWAYGFRNPWRFSYNDEYGFLVADVGQNVWEEVHIIEAGDNAGWNIMEGTHCFSTETPDHNPLECDQTGADGDSLQLPIIEYNHQVGITIIGGYIYQGDAMPSGLQGNYVFGDWSTAFTVPEAQIFIATPPPDDPMNNMWKMQTLQIANTGTDSLDTFILSFGEDRDGELYVLTSETTGPSGDTGKVWRIVPADSVN